MQNNLPKYYISYQYFTGDEFTGEIINSSTVIEAESDKEALAILTKRVVSKKDAEITEIHNVQCVSGLYKMVNDSIDLECNLLEAEMAYFTDFQKDNIAFYFSEWLYGRKS